MTTRSTASSGTDPQEPGEARQAPDSPPATGRGTPSTAHDAGRRAFFFQFGKQAATAAGQVVGMADIVGRTSSALAGELLGLDERPGTEAGTFARSGVVSDPVVSAGAPAAEHAFHSAFRLTDEGLSILDQRRVPEALEEVVAKRGSDVAYYLRLGVARGGPLMAQVAAYGMALTAAERATQAAEQRDQELQRTSSALTEARPSARLPHWAVARMLAAAARVDDPADGAAAAAVMRAEADAIAGEITAWEASMASTLVGSLPRPHDRALTVLLHGDHGPLMAGQLGAGLAALARLREEGQPLRVYVAEGRPFMDGARLGAWELRQAGIEHRIIPDAGAAWLLQQEPVDAVLMRAEWVAGNGDTGTLVGGRALAHLARSVPGRHPLIVAIGPSACLDPGTEDGAAIPSELRPPRELTTYLADVPVRSTDALVPAADVVPANRIDLRVTELGADPDRPA